ncbi:MAG: GTPase ObgE [Myxococcota bacterium]
MRFIDEIRFIAASGHGGPGAVTFLRERFVPRGGPDGGDGGKGGSVIFRATAHRNTLVDYRYGKAYRAPNGAPGGKRNMTGASGKPLELLVPIGTLIFDEETDELLADLASADETYVIQGGRGGKGNAFFKTSTHRTPRFAQDGEPGIERHLRLELRLIADVGLLGLPNAGKSTLISRISAAKPKIADYPFTTLVPNLGVVDVGEGRSFVMADIPGLIEGASDGAGLGHQFLRHLQRCRVIVHLVSADELDLPSERVLALRRELAAYDPGLASRPEIVVLSKTDTVDEGERQALLDDLTEAGIEARTISAVAGDGLPALIYAMWEYVRPTTDDADRRPDLESPPADPWDDDDWA